MVTVDRHLLARRLRDARFEAGLDQDELAERAGLSRSTISRLENEAIPRPAWPDLEKLARALGVTVSHLTGEPPRPPAELDGLAADGALWSELVDLAGVIERTPEAERRILAGILRAFREEAAQAEAAKSAQKPRN